MGTRPRRESGDETVTLTHEGDWYVATDETTGIASQGETKAKALENLAEALELYGRPVPEDAEDLEPSSALWID
ncbi:type II toxin-antitoxin system HicB family antitoxin [Saliphagus sp. GCM10025308]